MYVQEKVSLNRFNVFWMQSDEVHDLPLSTLQFSDTLNESHQKKNRKTKLSTSVKTV